MAEFDKAHAEDARFVIVVPTLTLLDQWFVALTEDTSIDPSEISAYSGEGIPSQPNRVNIMVINTARRQAPIVSAQGAVMLIVDECHRAGSPMNALALTGRKTASLGLSATPHRDYDDGFEELVRPQLGEIVFTYDYNDAALDGVIVPFELVNVEFPMSDIEVTRYERATRRVARLSSRQRGGEDVADALTRALLTRSRIAAEAQFRIPTAVHLVEQHQNARCIVFHERIRDAEEIARLIRERGRTATTYHSHLAVELRRDNLRLFRRGAFDVLVTCRALDEGFNVPEASVAIIASGTASVRQRVQRMGRVLRPSRGKHAATVYTLYATENEKKRLIQESHDLDVASVKWMRVR